MLLVAIGFCVGALGTLIGAGGGFILIPILLLLYPQQSNLWITSVSMFLVAMNATSGSTTYYLKRRVHLKAALAFFLASLPGSVLGVWLETFVSRSAFEVTFGFAVLAYAILLLFKVKKESHGEAMTANSPLTPKVLWTGCGISFLVGFIASFLGIGGGVIHVPLLASVLGFPVHLATGTSHLILALTAWFTSFLHFSRGDVNIADPALWQLGLSAVVGAQLGAYLSPRVPGHIILRTLAVALIFVGIRLIVPMFFHPAAVVNP